MQKNITADAGYESEENYAFLEANGQLSYIKPANYEISKTRKYRNDIGKIENMEYDAGSDIMLFSILNDAPFFTLNGAVSA